MRVAALNLNGTEFSIDVPEYLPQWVTLPELGSVSYEQILIEGNQIPILSPLKHRKFKKHIYTQVFVVYQEVPQ